MISRPGQEAGWECRDLERRHHQGGDWPLTTSTVLHHPTATAWLSTSETKFNTSIQPVLQSTNNKAKMLRKILYVWMSSWGSYDLWSRNWKVWLTRLTRKPSHDWQCVRYSPPPLSAGARLVGRGGRLPSQPGQAGTDGSLSGQLRLLLHITVLTIFTTSFPFISILTSTQDWVWVSCILLNSQDF